MNCFVALLCCALLVVVVQSHTIHKTNDEKASKKVHCYGLLFP